MPGLELAEVILAVIIGTLAAIVYSLRVLILMERRVASMEQNIQKMTRKIVADEEVIKRAVTKKRRKKR
jgi:predicted Holliday junction resolvase-like endonuclease